MFSGVVVIHGKTNRTPDVPLKQFSSLRMNKLSGKEINHPEGKIRKK